MSKHTATPWRYEIQYGPNGETFYAYVWDGGHLVGNLKTHDAEHIVKCVNEYEPLKAQVRELVGALSAMVEVGSAYQSVIWNDGEEGDNYDEVIEDALEVLAKHTTKDN